MKDVKNIKNIKEHYIIEPEFYEKYEVNRGLRKKDGTGVLIGITRIGDVRGYILEEGEKIPVPGKLLYRGINVESMIDACLEEKRFGFEETAYLLLFGMLPTKEELAAFCALLCQRQALPDNFAEDVILRAPSRNIMNKLAQCVLACYTYETNPDSIELENVLSQCIDLIARFPVMVAYAYQAKQRYYEGKGLYINMPDPKLSLAENFLQMLRADGKFTPLEASILDLSLILHAEHGGGNNSSFTVHVVSSTDTDTYSAIAAAIGSLKGPKHGGANAEVLNMMDDIKAHVKDWSDRDEVYNYLAKIIRKEAGNGSGLIYGMGHAIYTLSDPRSEILKKQAVLLAKEKDQEAEMSLYLLIEELAPQVFAEVKGETKVISSNVDFYSGFVYQMLGIPEALCTPIFAMSRIVGWCAHRIDELVNGGKIIRPAYRNASEKRSYVPMAKRLGR
ncbi:MAG: citrate/2-methylcitrate synthase [Oscillospiraceae bacterium]|nr:citrate/2-methylcitrate synthase [Oscillospiraceae bacterium]